MKDDAHVMQPAAGSQYYGWVLPCLVGSRVLLEKGSVCCLRDD